MQNFILDLLPVLLFFIVFQHKGIYLATWVGIIATMVQVLVYRFYYNRWENMQLFALAIFAIFGGMTIYFHNPLFVKWKPTVIFWLFACILLISQLIGQKPLVHRLIEKSLSNNTKIVDDTLPDDIGKMLNFYWMMFFSIMGGVNIYIAYNYSDSVWVNFKLYGITGLTMFISVLQALYILRYFSSVRYKR